MEHYTDDLFLAEAITYYAEKIRRSRPDVKPSTSQLRVQMRCKLIREELLRVVYHPDRIMLLD